MLIHKSPSDCKPGLWKTCLKRLTLRLYIWGIIPLTLTQYIIDRFKLQEA